MSCMKTNITRYLLVATFVTFSCLSLVTTTSAQTQPCGNIVGPEAFFNIGGSYDNIVTEPIVDCNDPFNVTIDPPSPYTLDIDGVEIQNGETYIKNEPIQRIDVLGRIPDTYVERFLFKHEENDYVFIDESVPEPTQDEYRAFAATYFETEAEAEQYLTILFAEQETGDIDQYIFDEEYEYLIDANTGESIYDRYYNFQSAANNYLYGRVPAYASGTYTMVMRESLLMVVYNSLWQDIREFFIKTAHAQYNIEPNYYTITFTIADPTPEPVGASSVLFIPGIMGSRLYEEEVACEEDLGENERWFSKEECDQLRLKTDVVGTSVNDIYAKSGRVGVLDDVYLISNIYDSFLDSLQEWEDEELINESAVFPYDWRLGLDSVVKSQLDLSSGRLTASVGTMEEGYLYNLISDLAEDSDNGKVTIVTHSNGGLVAKHFLDALDKADDPLLDKIENLILIAVPQDGTPDSVIGILHGTELDYVMPQEISRQLVNTMSFSHHLLPGLRYFDVVDTPIITFESGAATDDWRSTWGAEITSRDGLHNFLDKDSGRTKPTVGDLKTPEIVDGILLNYARTEEVIQGNWTPPETLRVVQIAGTGLETPSGLTYFTDRTCVKRFLFFCTERTNKISYRVNMIIDGDETVVVPSAMALSGEVEMLWLNLLNYNNDVIFNRRHKDVFEVPEISKVVKDIVTSVDTASYEYVTTERPNIDSDIPKLAFQLHSPLDLSLSTADGIISSSSMTINGGTYRRYGDLQYISVPRTDERITLLLRGKEYGSFTLDVEESDDGGLVSRQTYSGIPTATSTLVELTIEGNSEISNLPLEIDYDGDGEVDVQYTTEGVVLEEATYDDLIESIKSLNAKTAFKRVLLNAAKTAEKFYEKSLINKKYKKIEVVTLEVLKKQLLVYRKVKIITKEESEQIVEIIDRLINK